MLGKGTFRNAFPSLGCKRRACSFSEIRCNFVRFLLKIRQVFPAEIRFKQFLTVILIGMLGNKKCMTVDAYGIIERNRSKIKLQFIEKNPDSSVVVKTG